MANDWQIAQICAALLAAGIGMIFIVNDLRGRASRALAMSFCMIGLTLGVSAMAPMWDESIPWWLAVLGTIGETGSLLFGVEWIRRIGQLANGRAAKAARGTFIASEILLIVSFGLHILYLIIATEHATAPREGVISVHWFEWAVFGPIVGTALLLAGIGIVTLFVAGIDRAELVRLRSAMLAAPFLLLALIFHDAMVPILITVGLLIFLAGSVRFLTIQGERGQFMGQFVSPDVAGLLKNGGVREALQRERRTISVVVGDLRGFTDFARNRQSDEVADALEHFYRVIGEVVAEHGGTIKDHAGDGVLILIGAPTRVDDPAKHAATLSLQLMRKVQSMLADLTPELGFSVGVGTGRATVGAIQGAGRLEYVAVGNVVNLASRLCDRAKDGEILVDRRSYAALRHVDDLDINQRKPERFKGYDEPVSVYALLPN